MQLCYIDSDGKSVNWAKSIALYVPESEVIAGLASGGAKYKVRSALTTIKTSQHQNLASSICSGGDKMKFNIGYDRVEPILSIL